MSNLKQQYSKHETGKLKNYKIIMQNFQVKNVTFYVQNQCSEKKSAKIMFKSAKLIYKLNWSKKAFHLTLFQK